MKWLLVLALIGIVVTRRYLVGDLVRAVKRLPRDYADGKRTAEDPASAAKPVNDPPDA